MHLFLYIPLSLALFSLLVMTLIVWRKMPYLRKLTPESHQVGDTLLHDLAPELVDRMAAVPWRRAFHNLLVEFEKILRRGRIMMSSLDRASDRVIRGVRRVHQETARQQEEIAAQRPVPVASQPDETDELDMEDPQQLREEEQRLIVAIAQKPKDVRLYSRLASVYMRLANYSDAVEALLAAIKLDPSNQMFTTRLERAREKIGESTS